VSGDRALDLPIAEASRLLEKGDISARELVDAALDRIAETDHSIHAFLHVDAQTARAAADRVDRARTITNREPRPPLLGFPYGLKDNISIRGMPLTCGSRILEGYTPPYDATAVTRLREAGAIAIGKTNLDEFAMGSSTEFSAYGPTRNPRDITRVPGGSSGGSGAAVAAGQVPFALGSDTGGSVRLPASFCGVVGLKPTYGRISRYGLAAYGSSLDQIGPLARTVDDCAAVYRAIAGLDPFDSTTLEDPVNPGDEDPDDLRGLRIGLPIEYFDRGIAPGVGAAIRACVDRLAGLGAEVEEVSLPHTRFALAAYYVIAPAEASANLARYDGVKYGLSRRECSDVVEMVASTRALGFGPEVKRRIMLGTFALSSGYYDAYYGRAQRVREFVRRDFSHVFERVDVLATPTCPTVAFRLGERLDDPYAMYLADVLTVTVNCAGVPALVVPCGESEGLPVGLQLIGPHLGENTLFRVGRATERVARR